MGPFKCEEFKSGGNVLWKISGSVNESAKLVKLENVALLTVNLKEVTLINSFGVRLWCRWMKDSFDIPLIELEDCPFFFVNNFSMVKGFLGDNVSVKSFYVPYYSDVTQEHKDVLLKLGEDYDNKGYLRLGDVKDSAGNNMELDLGLMRFFSFLKRK